MKVEIRDEISLAKALKERRKELGVTQKDVAKLCNLSHNGISRIEVADSDIKLSTLLKMSKLLGFKVILEMED
ncbi:helix-turn-helix domain-containing protein [Halobacteriovorax sp. HLS]|uniref:helix-turn-helix domain-containing protein n=1 Tax=Halobacteriovorax sp. HLS TaxID=2234000 RepID=UPI000FDA67A6|nr:helix-turn-helix transcriptional regulator [Halobacteriovorax sp. HLS]